MTKNTLSLAIITSFALFIFGCQTNTSNVSTPEIDRASSISPEIWPKVKNPLPVDQGLEKRIADILSRMTLEEKIGQMIQAEISNVSPDDIQKYHLGSVLNGGGSFPNNNKKASAKEWVALADQYYQASADTSDGFLGIPILWGTDAVHGHNNAFGATVFPHNIGLGMANNPELIKKIAQATATEVAATGVDWTFAPAVAVVRDDRWGRSYEGFAETPTIVREYAKPFIEGLQGSPGSSSFLNESYIIATPKVFLGDGGTHLGKDQGNNLASEKELLDLHAQGFIYSLSAGAQTVMAGFNSWNGDKIHGHKGLLTDVLKTKMGFDGFVVSDWNAHAQVPGCRLDSCPQAIIAGIDMLMVPEDWKAFIANTIEEVKSEKIPLARIDDAVTRILRVKARYGLFDKPKPSLRKLAGKQELLGNAKHRSIAREAVRQSLVLLKNNDQLLPLNPTQHFLLLGDGANDIGKQCGGWTFSWQGTGNVNEDYPNGDSIYSAFKKQIDSAGGSLELLEGNTLKYKHKPDVAVMVFGEDPYAEFQGDKNTLIFNDKNDKHLKLLKALQKQNIPVVTIFISGRPMWVNPYINASQSFVAAWLPGSEALGIADVLLQNSHRQQQYDFQGKLSFSWPKSSAQNKLNYDQKPYDPLFAYGFGMTYYKPTQLGKIAEDIDEGSVRLNQSSVVFNEGQTYLPWILYLTEDKQTVTEVNGFITTSENEKVVAKLADKNRQGDSIRVYWSAAASAYFEAFEAVNLTSKSVTLHLQAKIKSQPTSKVELQFECEESCKESFTMNPVLSKWESDTWNDISLPLSCFTEKDIDLSKAKRLTLFSEGDLDITIHSLRFEKQGNSSPCPF